MQDNKKGPTQEIDELIRFKTEGNATTEKQMNVRLQG